MIIALLFPLLVFNLQGVMFLKRKRVIGMDSRSLKYSSKVIQYLIMLMKFKTASCINLEGTSVERSDAGFSGATADRKP